MIYPKTLSADLTELAEFYFWDAEDKKEIRAAFTDSPEMVRFFTVLAAAHRAGYEQSAANRYARLQAWCIAHDLGDPFDESFNLAELDAL